MSDQPDESGLLLSALIGDVSGKAPPSMPLQANSPEKVLLESELGEVVTNKERALDVIRALFPNAIPSDGSFFMRLLELQHRLGWGDATSLVLGTLWAEALEELPTESAERLLTVFPTLEGPNCFLLLDSLKQLLRLIKLRPEFARGWFPSLVRRIGNDLASGGFWNALGVYCEVHTDEALALVRLNLAAQEESEIAVTAFILGTLRALPLDDQGFSEFSRLNTCFAEATGTHARSVYVRSWIQTAWRGKMARKNLETLAARASSASAEEQQLTIWVFSRIVLSPSLPRDAFDFGFAWLRGVVSPTISEIAKYHVVDSATTLVDDNRCDSGELILAVQPVSADNKGTWQRMEGFLVSRLNKDLNSFVRFCVSLATRNARSWLKVMQQPQCFEWMLSEMRGKDIGALVSRLLLSDDVGSRKLGFFLFDDLDLESLPVSESEKTDGNRLSVILHEFQRSLVHGKAVACLLIVLIPLAETANPELQRELFDELVLQAKNYGGACRSEFERRAEGFPILKKVLEVANRYFDELGKVQSSPINQMEIHGYRQAARLYGRRFSDEISKGAAEASVFLKLFKNVQLLYGKQWRTFHAGKLSGSSDLQHISSTFEIPRLEQIDPEGMALRRLVASSRISQLIGKVESEEKE
jgi:hypothetical protein